MTYTEAARKSRELVERYMQKLLGFGYQDVDIQVPISSNRDPNRSDAYVLELRRVSGFFWHEECGFNLEIGLCGGYYAPDNIVEIFDDIIEFIGDATVLSKINIGKEFLEHARNKGFTDIMPLKTAFIFASAYMISPALPVRPWMQLVSTMPISLMQFVKPMHFWQGAIRTFPIVC